MCNGEENEMLSQVNVLLSSIKQQNDEESQNADETSIESTSEQNE